MSEPASTRPPGSANDIVSADDALPPVQPPSAGFIIQLFVIPGVIVFIIVMIWLMFNWLAQKGNDPAAYIRALSQNNESRWHAAVNLANALRSSRDDSPESLKNNADLARQLTGILDTELASGGIQDNPLMLRVFLCRALGEFRVNDGLVTLLKAAQTSRDPKENEVRRAALEAIALLAQNAPAPDSAVQERRQEVTLAASKDPDDQVRSAAAYALGVIGGEPSLARLRDMLADPYPDARFNAATGLARHGDAACVEVLCEMLDPDETAGTRIEQESSRDYKRAIIITNALRAGRQLAAHHPDPQSLAALREAATRLQQSKFGQSMRSDQIGIELTELLQILHQSPDK